MINSNKLVVIVSLVLAVAIPLTTWLAVRSQENRSKAFSENESVVSVGVGATGVGGVCGEIVNEVIEVTPTNNLACSKGAVNWMDSNADDGSYNWDCVGMRGESVAHCEALKQ